MKKDNLYEIFSKLQPSVEAYYCLDKFLIPKLEAGSKILEIGVGNGEISNWLIEKYEVYCLDISEECLDKLNNKIKAKFKLDLEKEKIPVEDNFFDAVICFAVLEHLKNFNEALIEIKRVLKNEGLLFASTPNISWLPFRLKFLFGMCPEDFHTADHVNFWNLKRFKKIFMDNGFKVVHQFTSLGLLNIFYPLIKKYRTHYLEIYDKYIFIATNLKSALLGYNQIIIAQK